MRIGIAADHAGFDLKSTLFTTLSGQGYDVVDFGPSEFTPGDDYPDFVVPLAKAVSTGEVERGLAICGSGVGASIAANKVNGARAGLCHDTYSAHQGVEHDNMNILVLGSRVIGSALAMELVDAFLHAHFTAEFRHLRRLAKVASVETER